MNGADMGKARREPDDLDEMLAEVEADPVARAAYEDAAWRRALLVRLVQLRGERRQREVATAMGTTQSAVSDLEQGRVDPRLGTLQRYVRAIGARLEVVIEREAA
jgi:predicted XRE-type DNA-binding protein